MTLMIKVPCTCDSAVVMCDVYHRTDYQVAVMCMVAALCSYAVVFVD